MKALKVHQHHPDNWDKATTDVFWHAQAWFYVHFFRLLQAESIHSALHERNVTIKASTTNLRQERNPKQQTTDDISEEEPPASILDLPPSTQQVILAIGTNRNPIIPRTVDGPCAVTIAFEPVVPELIPAHPQVFVVPAAVSDRASLATMYSLNNNGVSSSLSQPAEASFWNTGNKNHGIRIVPVVSMKDVIAAIPPNITISFLQTDTQGHDFNLIKSSIQEIRERGIEFLKTEVWTHNIISYEGVDNDICLLWIDFMAENGYNLMGMNSAHRIWTPQEIRDEICLTQNNETKVAGLKEGDAYWVANTSAHQEFDGALFEYPLNRGTSEFTAEQYAACKS